MGDLPHVNAGYIQAEETQFQQSTDTGVYRKIGKNQNFIKDQADAASASATDLFSGAHQALKGSFGFSTNSSGNYTGGIIATVPGKIIRLAVVGLQLGSYANYEPVTVVSTPVISRYVYDTNGANYTQYIGFGGGIDPTINPPFLSGQIINGPAYDQLYVTLFGGTQTTGLGTFPILPTNTGGAFNYVVIYKS